MSCPPGMILNPRSLRCVRASGRVAHNLVRRGDIGELDVGYYAAAAPMYRQRKQTYRAPRMPAAPAPASLAAAFGAGGASRVAAPAFGAMFGPAPVSAPAPAPVTRHRAAAIPELTGGRPCPPGTIRNPQTRRCIKTAGRIYKKLYAPEPEPEPERAYKKVYGPPPKTKPERTYSESSIHLPVGSASPAPIGDRATILEWSDMNCDNSRDPLTNTMFATANLETLQTLMRTHDGHCTLAPALNRHVHTAHRAGKVATLPADSSTHMTLDDFKALRETMRRQDPAYKIPGRRHQPPPPSWQLYIASDRRSGPEFASVMYVDTTKGHRSQYGMEYPPDSVRIDLGFIPVSVSADAICSPKTVSEIIAHLADMNKLLVPVAGGWKPVAGFPFKKSYWEQDRAARLGRLCQDMAKVLASPL